VPFVRVAVRALEVLFGRGDSDHPLWLLAVRVDILVFVACGVAVIARRLARIRTRGKPAAPVDVYLALAVTALGGMLRLLVEHNLVDLGGISYSRLLIGYRGHFGAAQLYSLVYARTTRDLEHGIVLNRVAATLTLPLVYVLCRYLTPATRAFAVFATLLLALHPLHIAFSATDALPICSAFIAAAAYGLLAIAAGVRSDAPTSMLAAAGAAAGLTVLTQVRYENVVLLVPALLYVWTRRRVLPLRSFAPAAALFLLFGSVYALSAVRWGSSFQNPTSVASNVPIAVREVVGNPIFGLEPALIGAAAALVGWRSPLRWLVVVLFVAIAGAVTLGGVEPHNVARTYLNQVLLLSLIAGYGLALLWRSRRWYLRTVAIGCLIWAAALPAYFWPIFRERHLETAEHDFFRSAVVALGPGIDRIIVPDDDLLSRQQAHSTIEAMEKYRLIMAGAGVEGIDLVGMTRFVEHPGAVDCSHDNCLLFRGVPCMGLPYYWFAAEACARAMATRGDVVREEDVVAGSFMDCSTHAGAARQRLCEPARRRQHFALYRVVPSAAGS
jgi:hypothetical protein